jgi:hypothetical protein
MGRYQKAVRNCSMPLVKDSVADVNPGSGAFLTLGTGIQNRFFRIPDPKPIFLRD